MTRRSLGFFIKDAVGCVIICDANRKETLDDALKWKEIIDSSCDRAQDATIPCILLQNKSDLISATNKKDFQEEDFLAKAAKDRNFINSYQVSVKNNEKLEKAMAELITKVSDFSYAKSKQVSKVNKSYNSVEDSLRSRKEDNFSLRGESKKEDKRPSCC